MIYLDNNATTRVADEVRLAMDDFQRDHWANPSSVHRFGQAVRQRLELAREQVAGLLGTQPARLTFTSGGTESNNLAIHGAMGAAGRQPAESAALVTTRAEHAAVREPAQVAEAMGVDVGWLDVTAQGRVRVDDLLEQTRSRAEAGRLVLVSVQWVNNETGVIQPIGLIAEALTTLRDELAQQGRRARVLLHVDATQAAGKLPFDVQVAPIDLLTIAGHKFHGPKGVGALYVRRGVRLRPQQIGGPQENQLRGGTENTAGIVGMGVAAELARSFVQDTARIGELAALRDRLEQGILAACPVAQVNGAGPGVDRIWNTSNIGFSGLEAEAILLGLSEKGVCASAGAACSSGSLEPSPVLLAMGVDEPVAHGSVRFSLSRQSTSDEIDAALRIVPSVVEKLSQMMPTG